MPTTTGVSGWLITSLLLPLFFGWESIEVDYKSIEQWLETTN